MLIVNELQSVIVNNTIINNNDKNAFKGDIHQMHYRLKPEIISQHYCIVLVRFSRSVFVCMAFNLLKMDDVRIYCEMLAIFPTINQKLAKGKSMH